MRRSPRSPYLSSSHPPLSSQNSPSSRTNGFTLVELLIVIVVIAVLAAITIIAFNGIRDRATTASLRSDLNAAGRQMEMARVDNSEQYPATLPSSIKLSPGNVLQLTSVTDVTKQYCINGYGPNGRMASYSSTSGMSDYLCSGMTVGSAVGGSVPATPRGVNLLAGFSTWTTSGGISYNANTSELVCDNVSSGTAKSPLIRVDSPSSGTLSYDGMATVASPTQTYSGTYTTSSYYAADGTTPAMNASPAPGPFSGNGNAPPLAAPFASWQRINWKMTLGPNVVYVRLSIICSPTNYTSDTHYRSPTYIIN